MGDFIFQAMSYQTKDDYQIYYKYYSTQTLGIGVERHPGLAFCWLKWEWYEERV